MFTGIVQGMGKVVERRELPGLVTFRIAMPEATGAIKIGSSVSVSGVCLTVTRLEDGMADFDAMQETLALTSLGTLSIGDEVNIERSARVGDEIGGHRVSGHVAGAATIVAIDTPENNWIVTFRCPREWFRFILAKGFIGLDGASLTVVNPQPELGTFQVYFIPETLRQTTFGRKKTGDAVNLEFDPETQAIVETVERVLAAQ